METEAVIRTAQLLCFDRPTFTPVVGAASCRAREVIAQKATSARVQIGR